MPSPTFAHSSLWQRLGLKIAHDRRIHYIVVSLPEPVICPNGAPYTNTAECFVELYQAIRDARYLGLIPKGSIIDRRNPEVVDYRPEETDRPAYIDATIGSVLMPSINLSPPAIWLGGLSVSAPSVPQRFHVEVWCEKSTMNDVLMPLGRQYGVNIQTGVGELSTTRCEELVERARASGLPVRILYLSDFDPAGQSMPLSVARKIEFILQRDGWHDIQVRHVLLTHDQCVEYRLPRTPIKEGETRCQ